MRFWLSILMVVVAPVAGCTAQPEPPPGCNSPVETGPLPEWARAGFTGDASMPHVIGDQGEIVAAIFGHPLSVSRPDGTNNKILWVSRGPAPPGDLVIEARLDGDGVAESRRVAGGPGPSIIDLPRPGCWRLTLTWPEHTDTMDLVYVTGRY